MRLQKIAYIRSYFKTHGTWSEFWTTLGIAFSVLVFSFLVLLITRALTNGYTAALNYLNAKTAKSTMVDFEAYAQLLNNYNDVKKERDTIKRELSDYDGEIARLNKANYDLASAQATVDNETLGIQNQNTTLLKENRELLDTYKDLVKKFESSHNEVQTELDEKNYLALRAAVMYHKFNDNELKGYAEAYRINPEHNISVSDRGKIDNFIGTSGDKLVLTDFLSIGFINFSTCAKEEEIRYKSYIGLIQNGLVNLKEPHKITTIKEGDPVDIYKLGLTELGTHIFKIYYNYLLGNQVLILLTPKTKLSAKFYDLLPNDDDLPF